jgi:hypothetical protein
LGPAKAIAATTAMRTMWSCTSFMAIVDRCLHAGAVPEQMAKVFGKAIKQHYRHHRSKAQA